MRTMEVLLREPVEHLGIPGDVVKVASGYARNYLLPRHLAVQATEHNKREVAKRLRNFIPLVQLVGHPLPEVAQTNVEEDEDDKTQQALCVIL